jgi:hypothetical protein
VGLGLLVLPAVMSFAGKCWSHRRRSQADRPRFSSPTLGYVIESAFDTLSGMSTKDQLLYSAFHGTAMRYTAEHRSLDESIEELRQIADGRNDMLAEAAGITAGSLVRQPRRPRRL